MAKQATEQRYYQTSEACEMVGISRMTFLRWVRLGLFPDVDQRDWKGWRQFTEADVARLREKVNEGERGVGIQWSETKCVSTYKQKDRRSE